MQTLSKSLSNGLMVTWWCDPGGIWTTIFILQCYDTVGWIIWPVKKPAIISKLYSTLLTLSHVWQMNTCT